MIHKLWILTLMQLSDKIHLKSNLTKQQKLGVVAKIGAKMAISYVIFTLVCYLLFRVLFLPPTVNLFIFVLTFMELIGIIGQTAKLSDSLYLSKDNAILLTYPVKHELTYASKILVAYILELYRTALFVFPLFMAFMTVVPSAGFGNGMDVGSIRYLIFAFIFVFLLPLLTVSMGALLSIPVAFIRKGIKKFTFLKIIALLAVVAVLFVVTMLIVKNLPSIVLIVQAFATLTKKAESFFAIVSKWSFYCQFVGYVMGGIKPFLSFLAFFGIFVGVLGLSILISMPLFFRLASSSAEHAVVKNHSGKNIRHKSIFATFVHKEFLLSIRNIGDFASDYLFLFLMPFVLAIMATIFTRIERNSIGVAMTYAFLGLITLVMLSTSSTAAATAISSEGNEFVLLKTAPSNTSKIVWSKLLTNFVISFIMLTISYVALSFLLKDDNHLATLWMVYGLTLLVSFGVMMWSIQLDVMRPKLKEYANSEKRSDVSNSLTSVSIGIGVAIVFSLIMIVVFLLPIVIKTQAMILAIIGVVFCLVRLYFLIGFTKAYFQDIEL